MNVKKILKIRNIYGIIYAEIEKLSTRYTHYVDNVNNTQNLELHQYI